LDIQGLEQNEFSHKANAGVKRRAAFRASDLNAKLDLGDETEKCHGLTPSASHEKDIANHILVRSCLNYYI